jgi:hypothetical protein
MHLTESSSSSYIEFGNPSTGGHIFAKLTNAATTWSTALKSSNVDGLTSKGLIFDSGSSNLYMPKGDLQAVLNFLTSKNLFAGCRLNGEKIDCACSMSTVDSSFPDILLTHGNSDAYVTMTFKPSSYFVDLGKGQCETIFITSSAFDSANYWLMGLPVYRAFEIVHDNTNMKLGFLKQGSNSVLTSAISLGATSAAMLSLAIISMY